MIRALAWFCSEHCGALAPGGRSSHQPAPDLSDTDEVLALIGRAVKYYPRMTSEARSSLCAARLAMNAAGWDDGSDREIGILAAGYEASLQANQKYFRDYVSSGRSMGRGNLFIYTLPTSTMGEIAIALSLAGPTMHVHDDASPLAALVAHADQLIAAREADGMLCLWSDSQAAVCVVVSVGSGADRIALLETTPTPSPLQLAHDLKLMVQR
jgi:3-oxoacyl-(acyl-carrier-protein) synthase